MCQSAPRWSLLSQSYSHLKSKFTINTPLAKLPHMTLHASISVASSNACRHGSSILSAFFSTAQDMSPEDITSLAYTAREINRIHTSLDSFNIVLWSDMELEARVASCLGCFDSLEHAYAYNKKARGNLGEEHLHNSTTAKVI